MISFSNQRSIEGILTFEQFKIKAHELVLEDFNFLKNYEYRTNPDFSFDKLIVYRNFDCYSNIDKMKIFGYDVLSVNPVFTNSNEVTVYHYGIEYSERNGEPRYIELIRNHIEAKELAALAQIQTFFTRNRKRSMDFDSLLKSYQKKYNTDLSNERTI